MRFPLNTRLDTLEAALEEVQRGASARRLDRKDLEWAREAGAKGRAWARRHELDPGSVEVLVRHIVPNSYRYSAGATNIEVSWGEWDIWRGYALKRSGGAGDETVVRVHVPKGFSKVAPVTRRSLVWRYHGGYAYL